jgi:hypothetical protein
MSRSLARIALVAALMVGVIAMHSFGHRGHTEESGPEQVSVMVHHHMAHGSGGHDAAPDHGSDDEDDPLHALAMLGFMICGGVLLRVAVEFLRRFWPRLVESLVALAVLPAFHAARNRFLHPPPLLRPTALLVNRIAVLRI